MFLERFQSQTCPLTQWEAKKIYFERTSSGRCYVGAAVGSGLTMFILIFRFGAFCRVCRDIDAKTR